MLKKFFSLALFSSLPLFLTAYELPQIIDFGKLSNVAKRTGKLYYSGFERDIGCTAFNVAPELTPVFAFLKREYNIDTVVETGTFRGNTTILFSFLFDDVHTIEVSPKYYDIALEKLKEFSNVHTYLGSSEKVLKDILPQLQDKTILFYLDAHWNKFWPLLDEIEEITKTHKDNCIIVVDDAKVPERGDIRYDKYGPHECSLEYIKPKLDQLFSSYTVHWLIPREVSCRAKLLIIPQKLQEKSTQTQ